MEEDVVTMREYAYLWDYDTNEDENKPVLKITKSSFGQFQWCPKKYEFNYIARLPQDQTEAMAKGTIVHNAREEFFNVFDIKKAETYSHNELVDYCISLHPIDDYNEIYETMAIFEANRFLDSKKEDSVENFLPIGNEILLDAEIEVEGITVHLQGIIDRIFMENGAYIPMELKTGLWKNWRTTGMRKEMAFYKILYENTPPEILIEQGLEPLIPLTHWGWYFPASNYIDVEPVKKRSETAVYDGMKKIINAYREGLFPTKFFAKTCAGCSYFNICDAANTESWV